MNTKKSLAWMSVSQILALILQFVGSVVLAHYLTPYQMGIYAVASATVGTLSIVQALGLQAMIVRERTLTNELLSTAFTVNLALSLALSVAILGLSAAGGAVLHEGGVRRVLLVLALNPLLGALDFLPSASFERAGRFDVISLIGTISGLLTTATTIGLAIAGYNYMSIAYASVVSGLVYAVLMNIAGRQHVRFNLSLVSWRPVANFGLQMLAATGTSAVTQRLSDIGLGKLQGLGGLGIYSRASGLNNLFWSNIHLVVGRVVLVDFSLLHRSNTSLRERYLRTAEMMTAVLWPVFAGLAVLSGPLILAVYGVKWVFAARLLSILCISSIVLVGTTMNWELFAATGELKTQTRMELIRGLFSLIVFLAAARISLLAAASARVLDAVFALVIYRRHINRLTQTRSREFLPIYVRSAALTLAAVGPSLSIMAMWRMSERAPLSLVVASIGVGILLWTAGLAVFRHPLLIEVIATVRGLRSRRTISLKAEQAAAAIIQQTVQNSVP